MKSWFSSENQKKIQLLHSHYYHDVLKPIARAIVVLTLLLNTAFDHHTHSTTFALTNTTPQRHQNLNHQQQNQQQLIKQPKYYAQHLKTKIASSEAKCERRKRERQSVARELCPGCGRPPILCVCEALPAEKIVTSTNILILQHPNEFKRKSLSTVPLMPLVLENCVVKVGYNFKPESVELVQKCIDQGRKPLLLFPGDDAISLDANNNIKEDKDNNSNIIDQAINLIDDHHLLILVDGTWAEAIRILKQSPELVDQCQQVQFTQEYDSIYDVVRKEPEKHCISTLEACAESLICLEGNKEVGRNAKKSLEKAMRHMVDIKRKIYAMRNPEPRFTRPGMKEAQRIKQAEEYEKNIFD